MDKKENPVSGNPDTGGIIEDVSFQSTNLLQGEPQPAKFFITQPPADLSMHDKVVEVLKTIYDPEIPVNIYELGLIYGVQVDADNVVNIQFTLTSPNCPAAQSLPGEMEGKSKLIEGVKDVKMELVWEPPWGADKMSESAKLQLGML